LVSNLIFTQAFSHPMHTYLLKVKHILPTFLIITLSSILGLVLIHWAVSIQFDLVDLPEEVWEIWLPIAIPCLAVLIWLRPRLWILTYQNNNGRFVFQLLAAGSLVAPMMITQSYLTTAAGKLENVATVEKIGTAKKARYYSIQQFHVVSDYGGAYTDVRATGRYNQYLALTTYFVYPIVTDTSRKMTQTNLYWHGVKFEKQISNETNEQENEIQYEAFYQECLSKMDTFSFHSLAYFERVPKSDERAGFMKAIEVRTKLAADENTVILQPITEPFDQRNGSKFPWIFVSFGIGLAFVLLILYFPTYDRESYEQIKAGKKFESDDVMDMLQYLIPRQDHFATSIILDLNLLVFVLMVFSGVHFLSPGASELLEWGANRRSETMGGNGGGW
jgi:rhomboid protease GluP